MNKKMFFLIILGCLSLKDSHSNTLMRVGIANVSPCFHSSISTAVDANNKLFKSAVVVALTYTVYKTGSYLYNRESNDVKIHRLNQLWNNLTCYMNFGSLHDVQEFLKEATLFIRPVLDSYQEMEARYNSWAKPWNWTVEMKVAYQKAKLLAILFRHHDIISAWNELSLDEQSLVKFMKKRNKGCSRYPLLDLVVRLRADIDTLEFSLYQCGFEPILIKVLDRCLDVVVSSDEYTEELRFKAIEDLQIRAACAAERAAWAVESSRRP